MNSPTITKSTTRPALGLTTKGRATVVLIRVRETWEQLTPEQQTECADLVARLSVALRAERKTADNTNGFRPLPLVGHISA